jgi:hypothetical protein
MNNADAGCGHCMLLCICMSALLFCSVLQVLVSAGPTLVKHAASAVGLIDCCICFFIRER